MTIKKVKHGDVVKFSINPKVLRYINVDGELVAVTGKVYSDHTGTYILHNDEELDGGHPSIVASASEDSEFNYKYAWNIHLYHETFEEGLESSYIESLEIVKANTEVNQTMNLYHCKIVQVADYSNVLATYLIKADSKENAYVIVSNKLKEIDRSYYMNHKFTMEELDLTNNIIDID